MKDKLINSFSEYWEKIVAAAPDIFVAVVVFVVFFSMGKLFQSLYKNRIQKRWKSTIVSKFFSQILYWVFNIVGILIALNILGLGNIVSSLLAGAGISAIIVGFAFKDIAENFLAGILLTIHRPFSIGDVIEVDDYKGPVKAVDMRSTHIRLSDGRDIWIPNSMLVKGVLTNYTRDGLLRQEFVIGFDQFDEIGKAQKLVIDFLTEQPEVLRTPLPGFIIEEIGVSSVNVKIMFWVDVLKKQSTEGPIAFAMSVKSKMIWQIKDLLLSNGFNLPSTIVEHKMYKEKKPLKISLEDNKS